MISKARALYQVKLILEYLPEEEYKLIPQETIDYIENNFRYDENITIDPNIPLEEQNIDNKAYEILDTIIKEVEKNKQVIENKEKSIQYAKEVNEKSDIKPENIELQNIIKALKKENEKLPKAKELLEEYKDALMKKEEEITRLKNINEELNYSIQKVPKFIRKIFIKDTNIRLLSNGN